MERHAIGQPAPEPMKLPYTKCRLSNGLDVIVHEDHHLPLVAVNIWYHVGSKNERPGRTGFAHLFEHLMFEGSAHHDQSYASALQRVGGVVNGSTNTDRTNYWEVVPTGALEFALWMESDRMGYLLPALTETRFSNQRDVVLSERRQNYESRPYGMASIAISAAMYQVNHPYHWPTIGNIEDLRSASLHEAHEFFATHYHPANASLALAGDIDAEEALTLAERYFGGLPSAPPPARVPATAPISSAANVFVEDRVLLPRLYLSWHSPAIFESGDAELDVIADVLALGKSSRLYRSLVFERRLAIDVSAQNQSRELGGSFQIVCTAAEGVGLSELNAEVRAVLDQLATTGPSAVELERAVVDAEAQFLCRLQTVGGFGGKSDQLNAYNIYLNDPGHFARDLRRYTGVTGDGAATAVRRWLHGSPAVTLSVVPRGRCDLVSGDANLVSVS